MIDQILEKKPHTLSGPMEELLAQSYEATQGAAQIFNMFNNADVRFPAILDDKGREVRITHGNYIALPPGASGGLSGPVRGLPAV